MKIKVSYGEVKQLLLERYGLPLGTQVEIVDESLSPLFSLVCEEWRQGKKVQAIKHLRAYNEWNDKPYDLKGCKVFIDRCFEKDDLPTSLSWFNQQYYSHF